MNKKTLQVIFGFLLALILVAGGAFLAGRLGLFVPDRDVPPEPVESTVYREVILYFADPGVAFLIPENREIPDCDEDEACVRQVVEALIQGPSDEAVPVISPQVEVRKVIIDGDTATIDFSRELVSLHPGGSISELLTVYGVTNTVAVNFPHLRQVRFLVEGAAVETLRGHIGLHGPVPADFRYARPPVDSGEDGAGASG